MLVGLVVSLRRRQEVSVLIFVIRRTNDDPGFLLFLSKSPDEYSDRDSGMGTGQLQARVVFICAELVLCVGVFCTLINAYFNIF